MSELKAFAEFGQQVDDNSNRKLVYLKQKIVVPENLFCDNNAQDITSLTMSRNVLEQNRISVLTEYSTTKKRRAHVGSSQHNRSELGSRKRSRTVFGGQQILVDSLELGKNSQNGSPKNFKGGSPLYGQEKKKLDSTGAIKA